MRSRFVTLGSVAVLFSLWSGGCSEDASTVPPPAPVTTTDTTPGALVAVSAESRVGVLLDELPESIRDRVAEALLAKKENFWIARAKRQLTLATYQLNFRPYFYDEGDDKQQLPLPPDELLNIGIVRGVDGAVARRAEVDGHDYVLADYVLSSMIVTDEDSPGTSEPALAEIGGIWDEEFTFPVDPELLVQRTGYACMDEAEFPPNSVDSEDPEFFYDQTCDVETDLTSDGCHYTAFADESCLDALSAHVGSVETAIHYERIAWDDATAKPWLHGDVTNRDGADLAVVTEELAVNRLTYRYIGELSCALEERCVGGTGWRRLLQFNASEKNLGVSPVNIGDIDYFLDDPENDTPNANHHVYEYSACHNHFHFSHYATFTYGGDPNLGSKRAFCLESVARYSNNVHSPTHSPYNDCAFQGISEGWGDQYNAGIECQWVDVTTIDTASGPVKAPLGFVSNPDGFLCEGTPVLDENGDPVWEPTEFTTAKDETVDRPKCAFMSKWDKNNAGKLDVTLPLPGEGLVTSPCTRGQLGLRRNCGYSYDHAVHECEPGKTTKVRCSVPDDAAPQAVRFCEASAVLGAGVACVDADALAQSDVEGGAEVTFSFTCPKARDDSEPGGLYAVYSGPSFPEDETSVVSCGLD